MADLPKERLDGSHAFEITGVDFCGPFFYKPEARNKAPIKCNVCVLICFATKAVHLELIKDLLTVLHGLKRFICTRRKPRNELVELRRLFLSDDHLKAVLDFCLVESIDWQFIPPCSPHFAGLWEAAVQTAKYHFYRAISISVHGFDELRTLLCHITAVINTRPLVPISESPADLDVLTPAPSCFLFWSRWKEQYITSLQQRSKWRTQKPSLTVTDLFLVKDENLPPMKWPLARVVELLPERDSVARVAVLKTATGITRRAVNKLCLLPLKDAVESQASNGGPNTTKSSMYRNACAGDNPANAMVIILWNEFGAILRP
ncbi:uncharacterized protein LOC121404392 [Drosophila obscura]|uniref:uncharacterized protein LOC121404392 n=1 Tax=Drosophila obscura TaxID=7282 RepID=UPI001BB20320|nr:uncharacterized protein LOC121404392 [Drosophila obscura]